MIQMQTNLDVADNSGARRVMCIKVLGGAKRRYASVGDLIVVSEPDGTFSVLGRFDPKKASALEDVPGFDELWKGGKREGSKDAGEKGAMV